VVQFATSKAAVFTEFQTIMQFPVLQRQTHLRLPYFKTNLLSSNT